MSLGDLALDQGDLDRARLHFREAKALSLELGNTDTVAWVNLNLGLAAHVGGDDEQARRLLEESLAQFRLVDNRGGIAMVLQALGMLHTHKATSRGQRPFFGRASH